MSVPLLGSWSPLPPQTDSLQLTGCFIEVLPLPSAHRGLVELSCSRGALSPVQQLRLAVHVRERQLVGGEGDEPELTHRPAAAVEPFTSSGLSVGFAACLWSRQPLFMVLNTVCGALLVAPRHWTDSRSRSTVPGKPSGE